MTAVIKSWANTDDEEDAMNDDHRDLWQRMTRMMREQDLSGKNILDFGCNQGGFLKMLAKSHPFARAIGVDIAQGSIDTANRTLSGQPIEYMHTSALADYKNHFDVAFSHEVLYLLADLDGHAQLMRDVLKDGGVYYAAIGCHTGNPQWNAWKELISAYSNVPVQSYSLDDYAEAFFKQGFGVSALPFAMDDFIQIKRRNEYFPKMQDSLDYYTKHKVMFRFEKN